MGELGGLSAVGRFQLRVTFRDWNPQRRRPPKLTNPQSLSNCVPTEHDEDDDFDDDVYEDDEDENGEDNDDDDGENGLNAAAPRAEKR